ncbi:hypothetical protein [Gemmatimonas groenlandica]|uniref:Uncharacterized protein n=1 Tax=Gemmatimonas groenlandica TaxID=2732249 RepID=A0A6M4IMC6_9BACT|nr:hypothetical protein [Gemmatimonas groenlandica]QJR35225.1 hypothetical protein HKW67_06760 [Gemmatimonas groenlandica]
MSDSLDSIITLWRDSKRHLMIVSLMAATIIGCKSERRFAGRYAAKSSDGMTAVFEFDTANRFWAIENPSNVSSYYLSGDTLYLSSVTQATAYIRNGDSYRYADSSGRVLEFIRIKD